MLRFESDHPDALHADADLASCADRLRQCISSDLFSGTSFTSGIRSRLDQYSTGIELAASGTVLGVAGALWLQGERNRTTAPESKQDNKQDTKPETKPDSNAGTHADTKSDIKRDPRWEPGKQYIKTDNSLVTKNAETMPTLIVYPTGERRQITYFEDNKSIKSITMNGQTEQRKTADSDDWEVLSSDKKDGPIKKKISVDANDTFTSENLEYQPVIKHVHHTNGKSELHAGTDRTIFYDQENRPEKIIDGKTTWTLSDLAKNEWKNDKGEIKHIAVEEGEYSYREVHDSKEYIHRFPLTEKQREIKAAELKTLLKTGKISRQFEDTVKNSLGSMPQSVIDLLVRRGQQVKADTRTTVIFPELKNVQPRGWPLGWTWDRADGLYKSDQNTVAVTESVHNGTRFLFSRRAAGVVRHETGHAVDHALGSVYGNGTFSSNKKFIDAYNTDVANLSARDKSMSRYTLQTGSPGREECFAEVFGTLYGGCCNIADRTRVTRSYPEVAKVIKTHIDALDPPKPKTPVKP